MTWRRSRLPLFAVTAVVASLALAGCGDIGEPSADAAGGRVLSAPGARTPPLWAAHAHPHGHPPDQPGRLTVHLTRSVALRSAPGGPLVARLSPRTEFGSATVLPVVRQKDGWLGVITSALPNGRIGWIAANARLVAYRTRWRVDAFLSRREIVVRRAGHVMQRFRVAVGSPSTPTPTGRFAVTDKLLTEDPSSPYGCCILALSAQQPNTPQGWGGGDRVAIHATNLPETIGTAASLGCLRAPAEEARRLVRAVPLGTVVRIRG
jgi:hypothetical protein